MPATPIFVGLYSLNKILAALCCLMLVGHSYAQLQPLKHTEFKESISIPNRVLKCIAEDANGIIWTASENALQWFDGTSFHLVPHGNGPHEIPGLFFNQVHRSPENEIWIFYNKGFSVYNSHTHSFRHYSDIIPAVDNEVFLLVAQTADEMVLSSAKNIYYVNRHTKKINSFEAISNVYMGMLPENTFNDHIIQVTGQNIEVKSVTNQSGFSIKRPEPLQDFAFSIVNRSIGLYATDHYVSFYDNKGSLLKSVPYPNNKYLLAYRRPQNMVQKNEKTVLLLLDDELWELDIQRMEFAKKLVTLTGKNFIANGYYKSALYDSRGNLWVTTNLHGMIKISGKSQPVQLIGPGEDAQNFVKCFKVNKAANHILVGTYGKGLMLYDTLGNFLHNFPLADHGEAALVTSIAQLDDGRYLVLTHSGSDQFIVNCLTKEVERIKSAPFSTGYYSELQAFDKNTFAYLTAREKKKVEWVNNRLVFSDLNETELQRFLNTGLIKARLENFKGFTADNYFESCFQKTGMQQIGVQVLIKRNSNWLFGTIKGIFEFDSIGNLLHTYNIKSGLSDEYIYSIIIDNNGDTWCSHNKGLSRIDTKGRIFNLNKEDGLQSDEFNYGAAEKTADGQLFFGGVKGLNAFYPTQLSRIQDNPLLLVTNISCNENILPADTAFWNVKSLKLPFENNQIKIKFSAIGNYSGAYYNYQYRVKGLDYEWKDLGHTQEINLALPSGNYTVEIAVSNSLLKELVAQKSIAVQIVPPYYQRWWFIGIAVLLLLGIAALALHLANKNKYRKKLAFIQMQHELESERQRISRDLHDNMGAYTTALLANVEKLRLQNGENDELGKMKNNADNILNSLRETIWVLNNKEINVADFSDAFKTYCVKALKNFEHINFEAGEIIDDNKILTAAEAVHFDKILKEAFQNIVKHSEATQIHFTVISNSQLEFSLTDNGNGYDINHKNKGNGLENMRWRAKEIAATLTIKSSVGEGSIISIKK